MQAHDQYLLTASEGEQLPSIICPDNATLFLRKHVRVLFDCARVGWLNAATEKCI